MSESRETRQIDLGTLQAMYQALADTSNRLAIQIADIQGAIDTLTVLERAKAEGGKIGPFLLPVGSYLLIRVPEALADKVLVNLGGNIYAEMDPKKGKEELSKILDELRQELGRVQATLRQIEAQLTQALTQEGQGKKGAKSR